MNKTVIEERIHASIRPALVRADRLIVELIDSKPLQGTGRRADHADRPMP
ncbi:MAG: hypothetical protein HLX51_11870 [Micrococcaceae bacterium]|nr:hypothetical protein [Micrococcaceae bacterium]